jgi:hypothetical protein
MTARLRLWLAGWLVLSALAGFVAAEEDCPKDPPDADAAPIASDCEPNDKAKDPKADDNPWPAFWERSRPFSRFRGWATS